MLNSLNSLNTLNALAWGHELLAVKRGEIGRRGKKLNWFNGLNWFKKLNWIKMLTGPAAPKRLDIPG